MSGLLEIEVNSLDNLLRIINMTDDEFCRYTDGLGLPMDWVENKHELINKMKISIAVEQLGRVVPRLRGLAS